MAQAEIPVKGSASSRVAVTFNLQEIFTDNMQDSLVLVSRPRPGSAVHAQGQSLEPGGWPTAPPERSAELEPAGEGTR